MIQFQGFKPESMPKIANSLGYNGDMQGFQHLPYNWDGGLVATDEQDDDDGHDRGRNEL